ncbi:MAG: PAS domain S-box protein [Candidatus Helarchaeota archaeon]
MENANSFNEFKLEKKDFGSYLDIIPMGIFELDLDTKNIIYANKKFLKIIGYTIEEFNSTINFQKIMYPKDMDKWINEDWIEKKLEFRIVDKNKEVKWLNGKVIKNYVKNFSRVLQIWVEDITEKKSILFNFIREKEKLELLNNVIITGNNLSNLKSFMTNVLEITTKFMDLEYGAIYLYNSDKNCCNLVEHRNLPKLKSKLKTINMDDPLYINLKDTKAPLIVNETYKKDIRFYNLDVYSYIMIPLYSQDEFVGNLILGSRISHEYYKNDLFFLMIIGQHIGMIIKKYKSEVQLKHSEEMFRALSEKSLVGILIIQNNKVFYANKRVAEITEYPLEKIYSMNFSELIKIVHPDDISSVKSNWENRNSLLKNNLIYHSFRIVSATTKIKWIKTFFKEIEINKCPSLFINFIDITELKETGEKLKQAETRSLLITENANDLIAIINKDGFHEYINEKTYLKITGYSKNDLMRKKFVDLIHPDDYLVYNQTISDLLSSGEWSAQIRFMKKDKKYIWIDIKGKKFLETGEIKLFLIARDVTEKKKREDEIKKQNIELKKLDKLKDEFFNDISHEFRTPLTAIKGFAEILMKSNNLSQQEIEDLSIILKNEKRLESLVNELLNYSRLKAGKIKFSKDVFFISDILNEIKTELMPLLLKKNLKFEFETIIDKKIVLDKQQITKVIKNLFTNAIKFSKENGKIYINSIINDNIWRFSIRDEGIGISNDKLPMLFSRFGKLDTLENINPNGIGIGLAICKKIIDFYGGKIWGESRGLNKGSKFTFQIDLSKLK